MIIHLDMDGVLADFEGYWFHLSGKRLSDYDDKRSFWNEARQFQTLYRDLWPMHDSGKLVEGIRHMIRDTDIQIEILTAIPSLVEMPDAAMHKEQWLHEHFGYDWKFKVGPYAKDKQLHAVPGDILIDDMVRNVHQWQEAGGTGIIHTSADNTLEVLLYILNSTKMVTNTFDMLWALHEKEPT